VGVKRKQHSAEFKARVAMASLSGEKTLTEPSAEFGVHRTMISNWKEELIKRAGELFARGPCRREPTVRNPSPFSGESGELPTTSAARSLARGDAIDREPGMRFISTIP
jgi:transposase-like protein